MEKLTVKQNKVARLIQQDIKVVSSPFEETGNACGLTAKEVLGITKELMKKGFIRKFCAILRHQKLGYGKNALVVWSVPVEQIEKVGKVFASFLFISHCYERKPAFLAKYNLLTMLHTKDNNVITLIKTMVNCIDINEYLILESIQEYKKISPEYFQ